jgi:hypothetical protein
MYFTWAGSSPTFRIPATTASVRPCSPESIRMIPFEVVIAQTVVC